ncbi:glycosyltransferase family 2 protein [Amycolatopsis sp. MEPSY49]|uniref:glycosyltransferase family 2 protein n=1 Tax=Amycolatopsis sp. MEPSY49 TaxID=3151600 RepID=UPI003EF97193
MTSAPRLSIGLPVYNGENYLAEALENLLAQTYTDYELIISDNASTDGTREICEKYAAKDDRIRYVRQPKNIGAAPNHDFLVRAARGELFKWAAHDDLFAPGLIEACVRALDEHPEAVLAHSYMAIVDERGEVLENYDYELETDSPNPARRFRSLIFGEGGDDYYGVIRLSVLRRIAPHDSYHNAGRKLVGELSLHGTFVQVPEVMFFRREHPGRGDNLGTVQKVCTNLDPRRAGQSKVRLYAEFAAGYVNAIRNAPLTATERRDCYGVMAEWLGGKPLRKIGLMA